MSKTLEYFYDFSSPYAYLAHEEAAKVAAAHGATLVHRPFFLGGLFKTLESPLVPINAASPQKRAWLGRDIARWAELRGLPYAWPAHFPMNTIAALRVVLQLTGPDQGAAHAAVCAAIFRAYWGEGRDISDAGVLSDILSAGPLAALGVDAAALLAGTKDPAVKASLFSATDEAAARGAVGAPTFFVGDLCFWGQDRFDMVGRALDGWRPEADGPVQ